MNSKQEKAEESQTRQSRPTVRWGRIVLITCAALFLLLAGVITAFFTVESMTLKPIVERIVTVLIDRPFILEGDFEAELGRYITVRVDGIKIGNGVWSSEPYMLTVDQPYAALDLWALTRGQILIRDAKVKSARLLFELSPEGKLNWELGEDSPDKEPAGPRLQSIPLLIEQADINDVHITLDLPAFEQSLEIQVDSAKLINGDNDVLDLVIAGSINEKPVNISGHIGPFTTLIVGGAVDFDLGLTPISRTPTNRLIMVMEVSDGKKEVFTRVQVRSGGNDAVTRCHAEANWRRAGDWPEPVRALAS